MGHKDNIIIPCGIEYDIIPFYFIPLNGFAATYDILCRV